ncbi:MAG: rhomboid family intramembrane serine protease [Bacteriovoracaceae bacterium]
MIQNFLVSWSGLLSGRIWTLVTSVFSHNMVFHILINMYVLYGFGTIMEQTLGSKRFLKFYLAAGIAGSLGHSLTSVALLHSPELPALGASGAISGVLVLFSLLYPNQLIFLFGIIPLPALFATSLFVGIDAWGLIAQYQGSQIPIGYGAHLGGAIIGLIYFLLFFWKRKRRRDLFQ